MDKKTILIIDNDASARQIITITLDLAGFIPIEATDSQQAYALIKNCEPSLILLDLMLPKTSGLATIQNLKQNIVTRNIPIIILTSKNGRNEDNKIQSLSSGADDYMTKPFSSRELIARIKTVLRRTCRDPNEQALSIDGLILDPISHRVTSHLKPIKIGPTEYRLLQFFMTHPEQAYTRNQLIEAIWNEKAYIEERTIDVHIRRLRKILGEKHNSLIQTVRGIGYRFSTKN